MEEQTAGSLSIFQKFITQKKTVFIVAGILIFMSYIGINIGIWKYATKTNPSASIAQQRDHSVTLSSTSTPIPTPTPLQGPGPYACDPLDICSHYKDAKGAGCPKTYADSGCLDECGDKKVQCPK